MEEVDEAVKSSIGRRTADTGPFETADLGGLDACSHPSLPTSLGEPLCRYETTPPADGESPGRPPGEQKRDRGSITGSLNERRRKSLKPAPGHSFTSFGRTGRKSNQNRSLPGQKHRKKFSRSREDREERSSRSYCPGPPRRHDLFPLVRSCRDSAYFPRM